MCRLIMLEDGSETKVCDLANELSFAMSVDFYVYHDIFHLQISMNDTLLMHVVKCHENLLDEVSCIALSKAPLILDNLLVHLHKVTMLDQLHDHVHVPFISQQLYNIHYVWMV